MALPHPPRFRMPRLLWPLVVAVALAGSGCSYRQQNVLFKDKAYQAYYKAQYKATHAPVIRLKPDSLAGVQPYRFAPGERLTIRFVNFPPDFMETLVKSFGLLGGQVAAPQGAQGGGQQGLPLTVDLNGEVSLPLEGRVSVAGMTVLELTEYLETRYQNYIEGGQVEVQAISMRATVLGENTTQVLLPREGMHLTEVLALSGGVKPTTRSRKVVIIRGDRDNPQLVWVNLQDIKALGSDDVIVQHGDLIYLETRPLTRLGQEVQRFFPIVSLINIGLTIALFTRSL